MLKIFTVVALIILQSTNSKKNFIHKHLQNIKNSNITLKNFWPKKWIIVPRELETYELCFYF